MSFKFWPSLKIIAYARIAQGILYTYDLEKLKRNFPEKRRRNKKYMKEIDDTTKKISFPYLSETFKRLDAAARRNPEGVKAVPLQPKIRRQLRGIVLTMGLEIKKWFISHKSIMKDGKHNLRNKLSWFSFGVIDRLETARNFIHDEGWDIIVRFHLACNYCFEDDLQMLWRNMTTQNRIDAERRLPSCRNIWLWFEALHGNIPRNWEEITHNSFFSGNSMGIRSYFPNLRGPEMRCQSINCALKTTKVHHYDLYSCISLLNSDELSSLRTGLRTPEICILLQSFLEWPFQIIFLDVVNYFENRISQDIFENIVTFILRTKLGSGFLDLMYIEIFKPFWNLFSAVYEDHIRQMNYELYLLATYILEGSNEYDGHKYRHMLNMYFSD
ncbi:uncharacterized protein TNIN_314871 [Trichonephila inaurata madagascariensis]|uniref:Uncharacterized protein n=1 Tax=Trichonephila inaurata madagascariensis TaxID=2747483 RepID=A0A8X6Y3R0_9ARAC|nr:uncharacterized protein TNIN_314871 [Trichonephila inaurata madagascariensis]